MSNEYVWQPKDDQENAILAAANHLLRFGHPPVGERLCRRVPAPQGVSVPVEVRAALGHCWRWAQMWAETKTGSDERYQFMLRQIDIVLNWLDSQRQQPQQPQPDWSQAPGWATHAVVTSQPFARMPQEESNE